MTCDKKKCDFYIKIKKLNLLILQRQKKTYFILFFVKKHIFPFKKALYIFCYYFLVLLLYYEQNLCTFS